MRHPLAVFAPNIGTPSETFIRRHMSDILPGGTLGVGNLPKPPENASWSAPGPVFNPHRPFPLPLMSRWRHRVAGRLGIIPEAEDVRQLKRFLREHGVKVILAEYLDYSLMWLDTALSLGIPFFAHAHGYDVSERLLDPKWRTEYLRLRQAGGIITVSEHSRQRLIGIGLPPEMIHVAPCGVDVPDQPLVRPEQEAIRCLSVGRMVPKKAPILCLDAFRRAAERCPRLELDCVGGGPLFDAARQYVHAFGLRDRIRLLGPQPAEAVRSLMTRADIFLQHSVVDPDCGDEEGLPVALLEAMALALPVVSTRHAGIPEAITDDSIGFLVDEGNNIGMSDLIVTLAENPPLRRSMGESAWKRAGDRFSWERERRDLLRLFSLEAEAGI